MNTSIAPMDFAKDIKVSSSVWMKRSNLFPSFYGWAVGYGSFTCSYMDIDRLIEYIKNQQERHKKMSFEDEYRKLLFEYGITPDEKYFP
jgi:hypothetical protein